jgi:hypothetical protein
VLRRKSGTTLHLSMLQASIRKGGKSRLGPVPAAAAVCARMGVGRVCSALHQKSIELKRVWWSGELERECGTGEGSELKMVNTRRWRLGSAGIRNRSMQAKRLRYFMSGCKWCECG